MSTETDVEGVKFHTINILEEVALERRRQDEKWGQQDHPWSPVASPPIYQWLGRREILNSAHVKELVDRYAEAGMVSYSDILFEEVAEALDETDIAKVRAELVQVAAVAVAAIESIDRNGR